jgi:hypothetical protein
MVQMMGASLGLIALSAGLLFYGWVGPHQALLVVSIAASVGAGVTMSLAYFRTKTDVARMARRRAR